MPISWYPCGFHGITDLSTGARFQQRIPHGMELCEKTTATRSKDVHMIIYCFKTILVFQRILQSYDGVLVSQEVAIQSDNKVDLPFSPTSLDNFLQVFLSVFLWFYFHFFHLLYTTPETGSGSPPQFPAVQVVSLSDRRLKRNIRPLQKALPKAGKT